MNILKIADNKMNGGMGKYNKSISQKVKYSKPEVVIPMEDKELTEF